MRLLCALAGTVLAPMALAGCEPTPPPSHPLAGTGWELVSMESMSDEQGTTAVDDPARYTVAFGADGHAAFRIDCNRGSASWQATASAPDSGSLRFGLIALTRMACPQPSLEQRVITALGYVRGYRLIDGRLYMSLLADGGILHWQPVHQTGPGD